MSTRIICGDALATLRTLPSNSVHSCISSPPYYSLRSYLPTDHPDKALELGSEPTVAAYIAALVGVFRECRRVMRPDASLFVNLGDSYTTGTSTAPRASDPKAVADVANGIRRVGTPEGMRAKSLLLIPQRVAIALAEDGWIIRSVFPWVKRSCLPESVTDRATNATEYVIHAVRSSKYFWDQTAVQRPAEYGRRDTTVSWHEKANAATVGERIKETTSGKHPETGRNFRNTDLFFDSLEPPFGAITDADGTLLALDVNPEPTSFQHYACFPSKLVSPLIRASTSERGCCVACGKQWTRTVGEAYRVPGRGAGNGFARPEQISRGGRGDETPWVPKGRDTLGWSAACRCPPSGPVPATVLDCFAGACTTLLQAQRLGRDAIGIELSSEYVKMGQDRIEKDAGFFADVEVQRAAAPCDPSGVPLGAPLASVAPGSPNHHSVCPDLGDAQASLWE